MALKRPRRMASDLKEVKTGFLYLISLTYITVEPPPGTWFILYKIKRFFIIVGYLQLFRIAD